MGCFPNPAATEVKEKSKNDYDTKGNDQGKKII
jgi:hypothetical protein